MNITSRTARALSAVTAASLLSLAPGVATFAQSDDEMDEALEEIVTTGSRIRRDNFTSTSPMTMIGGQAILEAGVSNLGEALRDQAAIGTGGFNQSSILSGWWCIVDRPSQSWPESCSCTHQRPVALRLLPTPCRTRPPT